METEEIKAGAESGRSIDVSVRMKVDRSLVWSALTDPSEIPRWLAPIARVEPGVGGFIELSWGEGMTGRSTIEVWRPPERLVLSRPGGVGTMREDYRISETGDVTTLTLHHSGFAPTPDGDDEFDAVSNGWRAFFRMLEHGLTRHARQPFRNVTAFTPLSARRDTAWAELVRPGTLAKDGLTELHAGDEYSCELVTGQTLKGQVVHCAWPGYLVLSAGNLGDSLFALFCERSSEGSLLTVTWILNGDALALTDQMDKIWKAWIDARRASAA